MVYNQNQIMEKYNTLFEEKEKYIEILGQPEEKREELLKRIGIESGNFDDGVLKVKDLTVELMILCKYIQEMGYTPSREEVFNGFII